MPALAVLVFIALVVCQSAASASSGWPEFELVQRNARDAAAELLPADSPASLLVDLEARFDCKDPAATAGLFVSIADTFVAAPEVRSPQAVRVSIPPERMQGVQESFACPAPGPQLLRSQLTAYGTLTCRGEDGREQAATVSAPVDLWVECGAELQPEERPGAESLEDD